MKTKSKKAKGRRLELQIAKDLREAGLDSTAGRMPLSGAVDTLKSDILTNLPIHIECKNQQRWDPMAYYQQAQDGKKQQEIPIVVMSRNRLVTPMALLSWKDLIYLMQWAKQGGWDMELPYSKRRQLKK